ncbi:MAG: exodeoxyribonuclease VII large subunit, partial [Gemmatimonadota bacterium]|nr:exodeoxyribonuclease VII large subunit [Gemmatimonadota bacterium]
MKRGSRRPVAQAEVLEPQLFPVSEPPRGYQQRAVAVAAVAVSLPAIPGTSPESAVTIEMLTQQAKMVVEGAFPRLWIRGEICNFKSHGNGHWYFSLRGAAAQIKCVLWARDQRGIPAMPEDGMQVVALAQLTVYPARGDLQCTITALDAVGDGLWRKALDQATERLRADGLLEPSRKRALPRLPRRVAVITSPDGAALRDIIAVMRRRCPTVEIVLVPAKVQGDGAPADLARAIECVVRWGDVDTVIIGRGGGGREDLWAFNSEIVARALAACTIPTISAVGHEVDITLCDLVADHRAATPSAAAEAAVPVLADARAEAAGMLIALREP